MFKSNCNEVNEGEGPSVKYNLLWVIVSIFSSQVTNRLAIQSPTLPLPAPTIVQDPLHQTAPSSSTLQSQLPPLPTPLLSWTMNTVCNIVFLPFKLVLNY